jgi:hypothetical protein
LRGKGENSDQCVCEWTRCTCSCCAALRCAALCEARACALPPERDDATLECAALCTMETTNHQVLKVPSLGKSVIIAYHHGSTVRL